VLRRKLAPEAPDRCGPELEARTLVLLHRGADPERSAKSLQKCEGRCEVRLFVIPV
jgi:hypothetical protein